MVDAVRASGISPAPAYPRGPEVMGASIDAMSFARMASEAQTSSLSRPGTSAIGAAIGLDGMLALQAVDEAAERDRRARKRGMAMMTALSDVQRALLTDEDPAHALRTLSALTLDEEQAADPDLAAILRAIALRSRLEVARRKS